MDSRHAGIPNTIHSVAHRFSSQRSFFSNWNIAGPSGHDRYRSDALVGFVSTNSDKTRRLVPFSISHNIANLAKRAFVSSSDEYIRRTLHQPFNNADNLRASLAAAENDFRKALARSTRMIYARKTDVLEMKIFN